MDCITQSETFAGNCLKFAHGTSELSSAMACMMPAVEAQHIVPHASCFPDHAVELPQDCASRRVAHDHWWPPARIACSRRIRGCRSSLTVFAGRSGDFAAAQYIS